MTPPCRFDRLQVGATTRAVVDRMLWPGLSVVYGPSGDGKSFFLARLLASVATGRPFAGRDVQAGSALLIDCETPLGHLQARLRAASDGCDTAPEIYVAGHDRPLLGDPAFGQWLDAQLSSLDTPRVAALDTVSAGTGGRLDMDSNRDAQFACSTFTDLARDWPDVVFLLVHHSGHDERRMRGASALFAACHSVLRCAGGVLRDEKQRLDALNLHVKFALRGEDVPVWTPVDETATDALRVRVRSLLVAGSSANDIQRQIGGRKADMLRLIADERARLDESRQIALVPESGNHREPREPVPTGGSGAVSLETANGNQRTRVAQAR